MPGISSPHDTFGSMHQFAFQCPAGQRSMVGVICVFLALIPTLCTAAAPAVGSHHGGGADHHGGGIGGMSAPAHLHWGAAPRAELQHHTHACCSIAAQKPTREDGLVLPGSIGTSAETAQVVGISSLAGSPGRSNVDTPFGTPGLSATSAPLRC